MCEGLSSIVNNPIPPHPMFMLQRENTLFDLNSSRSSSRTICEGPSKISGPIASHYGLETDLEKSNNSEIDYAVNPRVRNAGKSNFMSDKKGNGVAMLIELQGRAITPKPFKLRETPKNHLASNTVKIKQLMRKVKEREAQKEREKNEKNVPVKALWKSEKYKDVQSKIKETLQQPLAPRETTNFNFLRAHAKTGSRPQSARQAPKETELNILPDKKFASKDDLDFIKHNALVAKSIPIRRAPSLEMLKQVQEKLNKDLEIYKTKKKGKVPNYLEQRKLEAQKELEEQIKNMPDPDQPPGHRKLANEEREKTLNVLKEAQQKLLSELNSMPIRNDTFRLKTTKNEMEKKLTELEEAIKIFSKPKVFVKIE